MAIKKKKKPTRRVRPRKERLETLAPEILDVPGAAEFLAVSRSTVYALVAKGTLPGKKVGKEWRFSRRRLITWLEEPDVTQLETLLKGAKPAKRKR